MNAAYYGAVAVVLSIPVVIGGVYAAAWSFAAVAVGALLAVYVLALLWKRHNALHVPAPLWLSAGLVLIVVIWILLQAMPDALPHLRHPAWSTAAPLGTTHGSISLTPARAEEGATKLLLYAAVFVLAWLHCQRSLHAYVTLHVILVASVGYAGYGIVMHLMGADTVLWWRKPAYLDDLTSTFVNRNSYACFAALGLLCATALLVRELQRQDSGSDNWRNHLLDLIAHFGRLTPLYALAVVVLAMAILMTHSRGGLLVAILGLLAFFVAMWRRSWHGGAGTGLVLVVLFGALAWLLSGDQTWGRFLETFDQVEFRWQVYELTIAKFLERPWLGAGYGSFGDVFAAVRTVDMGGHFAMAHNTYLELALELGLPATILLLIAVAIPVVITLRGTWLRRRDRILPCLGLAASVVLWSHAMIDFSPQIPAIAALYSLILGVGVAQSFPAALRQAAPGAAVPTGKRSG